MLNIYAFPAVLDIYEELYDEYEDLTMEGTLAFERGDFKPWPEKINTHGKWQTLGTKWQGESLPANLPMLNRLTRKYDRLLVNAGYSILEPGAVIAPHRGYSNEVLRFHFGLLVPRGDCQLKIGQAHFRWTPRGALLFDDTEEHEAWNYTKYERLIILLDLNTDYL